MICPSCGRESGWHSVECQAVSIPTCGMGTYPFRPLGFDETEVPDCAVEGFASIDSLLRHDEVAS